MPRRQRAKAWRQDLVQLLLEADDNEILDRMVDDSPQLTFWLFENNNSGSSPRSDQFMRWTQGTSVRRYPDKGQDSYPATRVL